MSRHEKLLAAMRVNPRNVRKEDLDRIAPRLGVQMRHGAGHDVYYRDTCPMNVAVPRHPGLVDEAYVREFLSLIDWEDGDDG